MQFHVSFDYFPQVADPSDHIYDVTVDILCSTDGEGTPVLAGRVALEHLDIGRAVNANMDLFDICDGKSQEWYEIHRSIFEPGTYGLKHEFRLDEPLISVMYVKHFILAPELGKWQTFVFDSLSHPYSHESAFIMRDGQTDLTERQLARLGFRKITGTEILLRPNMDKHRYEADGEKRDVFDVRVPSSAADYVNAQWQPSR